MPGGAGISGGKLAQEPWRSQGAISIDGSVAYFTTRPANVGMPAPCDANSQLRILRRSEDSAGAQIDHVGPELPTPPGGHDFFQGASVDGTKIYFTTTRPLVAGDLDAGFGGNPCGVAVGGSLGCDLYLYDSSLPAGEQLIQVSAGEANSEHPTVGADANVLNGVTAISGDGARVYFVAQGVLTEDAGPKGTSAAAGQPNLYVWHEPTETTAFIGTLVEPDDRPKLWGSQSSADHHANAVPRFGQDSEGNEVGGDGRILTFVSRAPLTGDDVGDGGHSDVFRYDALTEELIRISKAALGGSEEPFADVEIENFSPEGDQVGRWTSEDGRTIAFSSAEPLSPGDADSQQNPFLWRDGDLVRLPGTINRSTHPKVSPNGNEVSFQTASSLLPQDGDTARDIYVARIDGGFPPPPIAEACQGEACQGAPASPPVLPGVQTNAFAGSGNLQAGGKPRCGKGKVRRKGRCVSKRKANRKTHSRANRRAAK